MKSLLLLVMFVSSFASFIPDNVDPKWVEGWPHGMYGIPRSNAAVDEGCPDAGWMTGWRFQDMEDSHNNDAFSSPNNLYGEHGSDGVYQGFCMKGNPEGNPWPTGDYCLYKYQGESCPEGFTTGGIHFDDEDSHTNDNSYGSLPEGFYSDNTDYTYCCRADGSPVHAITLPTEREFYLFPHTTSCQQVEGMTSSMEWIYFDTEDHNGEDSAWGTHPKADITSNNIKLFYCYYEKTV